jgi:alpha/beta superfamily hydrolase
VVTRAGKNMTSRSLLLCCLLANWSGLAAAGQEDGSMDLERSVCGLKEPLIFWLWSTLAGSPDAKRVAGLPNVEDISFQTKDNRTLRGYRLKADAGEGPGSAAKGYLLIMQGNAMLADQIISEFADYSAAGFDVYMYDFRGYGRSGGRRRLTAIISDYAEILAALNLSGYGQRLVYAMSFGGIALLDGFAAHAEPDLVIVDSTPSRLSDYGCPPAYDPVNNLPEDCSRFLFIAGRNDRVVTPAMSEALLEAAQQRGASILRDETFAHPFMDPSWQARRRRMEVIEAYFLYGKDS